MSLKKRINNKLPALYTNYNKTPLNNPSREVDQNTNYIPRPITYEDIDMAMRDFFNNKFVYNTRPINITLIDAEVASIQYENKFRQDTLDGFVKFPYLTLWRSSSKPIGRVSPSMRKSVYRIPVQKEQGIVYEEYLQLPPRPEELTYELRFLTTMRGGANEFEQFVNDLFVNRYVLVEFDKERFQLKYDALDSGGELEVINQEDPKLPTMYSVIYTLTLWAYRRGEAVKSEGVSRIEVQVKDESGITLSNSLFKTERKIT